MGIDVIELLLQLSNDDHATEHKAMKKKINHIKNNHSKKISTRRNEMKLKITGFHL